MFDGLMTSLIKQGMNPIALAVTSLKDPQALALVNHTLKQSNAKLVLSSLGFASNKVDAPSLSSAPTQFNLPIEGDLLCYNWFCLPPLMMHGVSINKV